MKQALSFRFCTIRHFNASEIKETLKQKRIYSEKSTSDLFTSLATLKLVKRDYLVDNGPRLFELSQKILGKSVCSAVTKKILGSYYIGGENLTETVEKVKQMNKHNIAVLSGYAIEHQKGMHFTREEVKEHVRTYVENIDAIKDLHERNTLEVKFSALADISLLKKYTIGQCKLVNTIRSLKKTENGRSFSEFVEALRKEGIEYSVEETEELKGDLRVENGFISDAWPAYAHVFNVSRTSPSLSKIAHFTEEDEAELRFLSNGLHEIVSHCRANNVRVLLDAEQSYIQGALHSISEQLCTMYNSKNRAICFNTVQNYLKEAPLLVDEEIAKCNLLKLPLALKLVRGAYIVEETKLAQAENRENPIWDSFELTSASYHNNLDKLMKNLSPSSQIFVASHNSSTIEHAISYNSSQIMFGQLYGIGDHLTHWLSNNGFPVHKYLPFGNISIMVPYLLRRAQESKQMFKSSPILEELVSHEIKQRFRVSPFSKRKNENS